MCDDHGKFTCWFLHLMWIFMLVYSFRSHNTSTTTILRNLIPNVVNRQPRGIPAAPAGRRWPECGLPWTNLTTKRVKLHLISEKCRLLSVYLAKMPKSRSQVYNRYLRGREVGHRRSLCLSRDPLTSAGGGRKGVLASAVVERLYRDGGSDVMHSEFGLHFSLVIFRIQRWFGLQFC